MPTIDSPAVQELLVEVVEKMALVRRDLKQNGDLEKYAARVARIDRKVHALADTIQSSDPRLATAIRKAWDTPARSLAERNVAHRKLGPRP